MPPKFPVPKSVAGSPLDAALFDTPLFDATAGRPRYAEGGEPSTSLAILGSRFRHPRPLQASARGGTTLLLCLILIIPMTARAEDPSVTRQRPPPPMREITAAEAGFTATLSIGILTAALIPGSESIDPSWQGGLLFDDGVRNALMLGSPGARATASRISDGIALGLVATPALLDAVVMGWLVRGEPELMGRMLLIDLQAHAFAQGLTTLVKRTVRRERPMARGCREDPERRMTDPSCDGQHDPDIAPESFFSGHSSLAFTSASLICLHHTELGLFGQAGDAATCATAMALATAVGALRIAADRHYATDVILGAGVGVLSGWLVPWLLHYDVVDDPALGISATVAPMVDGDRVGAQLFGLF